MDDDNDFPSQYEGDYEETSYKRAAYAVRPSVHMESCNPYWTLVERPRANFVPCMVLYELAIWSYINERKETAC